MTTVINLPLNKTHKKAYIVHNFKQVEDTVIMIMYVEKLHSWKKIFFNYEQGFWHTDQYKEYIDAKTSTNLQKQLSNIFYQHDTVSYSPQKKEVGLSADHALMLCGGCN